MQVRFWGVRGSVPVSGKPFLETGGHTSCVEVFHEGQRLILDGGTGLAALGRHLGCAPVELHLVFSHTHWDHIQGVPFFAPAFHPGAKLHFVGPDRVSGCLRGALEQQMTPPQFPIGIDGFNAQLSFSDLRPGRSMDAGPFTLTPIALEHPHGSYAWRIEAAGKTVVYATDHEHAGTLHPHLLAAATGADLLIHDAQYTEREYQGGDGPSRRGWGHSTWTEAVACAQHADVGRLALFHHDPRRSDAAVAQIEAGARALMGDRVFAAREGRVVAL